jgi:hypothetical protein
VDASAAQLIEQVVDNIDDTVSGNELADGVASVFPD